MGWERAATTPTAEATTCRADPHEGRPADGESPIDELVVHVAAVALQERPARRSRRRMATAVSVTGTATSSGTAHHTDHRVDASWVSDGSSAHIVPRKYAPASPR